MIRLNTQNGLLEVDNIIISQKLTVKEFKALSRDINLEKIVENGSYSSFGIKGVDDYCLAIAVYFFDQIIKRVVIFLGERYGFPPFIVTSAERAEIDRLLKKLGGAKNYDWGSVEVADDPKGGSISVIIRYNQ